jgi:hypothetical protein
MLADCLLASTNNVRGYFGAADLVNVGLGEELVVLHG